MKSLLVPARPPGEARQLSMLLVTPALRGLNREQRDAVVGALSRARGAMEAVGGSMTLSQAPAEVAARVGWTGGGGGGAALGNRIKDLFDPASVLAARCP